MKLVLSGTYLCVGNFGSDIASGSRKNIVSISDAFADFLGSFLNSIITNIGSIDVRSSGGGLYVLGGGANGESIAGFGAGDAGELVAVSILAAVGSRVGGEVAAGDGAFNSISIVRITIAVCRGVYADVSQAQNLISATRRRISGQFCITGDGDVCILRNFTDVVDSYGATLSIGTIKGATSDI